MYVERVHATSLENDPQEQQHELAQPGLLDVSTFIFCL